MRVPRTCTEISRKDGERAQREESQSRPLEDFREAPAYVLVGDPGAGKTTAFEAECAALGDQACLVTARDFLTFKPQDHPEWGGKILFIDGLDEVRAGSSDVRTPFDQVRAKLDALGKPPFRLSCREADWLGENDRKHLESVSPDSQVKVLRLDPLTDADIASILEARGDIPDAGGFVEEARRRGVEGLLENPQTLEMLAVAVAGGAGWPKSRMETFEKACRQMVREHNEEHQAAQEAGSPPAAGQLLDAAGRLCALHLISGSVGYKLRGEPEEDYPALDQCDPDHPEALHSALFTKLFKGAASSNRSTPVHRRVAEFLGGRYLAGVIQDGLPARRVIALMTGEDGVVVTELRGLSAWLAAHSPDARADLIERDPIGVGLYGDIGEFSNEEKRALLGSLKREGERLGSLWQSAAAFGALAAPEMEADLREVLRDSDRTRDHQAFTDFVLRFLAEGTPLPDLGVLLIAIVRDDKWWPRVNTSALNAFIHNCPDGQDKADELRSLLADTRAGRVSDPDNELLGLLLYELYPRHLSPSQVMAIYSETSFRESHSGMYSRFFWSGLLEKSSDDQVAELLDILNERPEGTRKKRRGLQSLSVSLLARGLQAHGDQLPPKRLHNWLVVSLPEGPDGLLTSDEEAVQEIRSWLEERPEIQKALILEGVIRSPGEFSLMAFQHQRLHLASPPPDFGLWCLQQAVSMADAKPLVSERLLKWALEAHRGHVGDAGLSLAVLREYARKKASLRECLDQLLSPAPPSPISTEHLEFEARQRQKEEEEGRQRHEYVESHKTALLENRAPPYLLFHLARLYFEGAEAIQECVRGDRDLGDAVLQGLRGAIDREDVPDVEEILSLREQGEMHYLGLPFLAGIAEAEKTTDVSQWEEDRIRKAVAFYYCSHLSNHKLQWYQRLLAERPEIVADIHVQFAASGLRSGREHFDKLSEFVHDPEYAAAAGYASLPLLRAFPTRCRVTQIEDLKYLLWAALRHAERASLRDLIEEKVSKRSMNVIQRVYWLAAGIVVAPEIHGDELEEFLQDREDRIRHLIKLLAKRGEFTSDELGNCTLEMLLCLVGKHTAPYRVQSPVEWAGSELAASEFVHGLIRSLSASRAAEASDALARLLADPELSSWRGVLSQARDTQRVIRRDAGYRHPGIEQVCQTLNGGTPASAADLAALLMDRLQEVALDIRRGNTDDWRQYWNVDYRGRPVDPRPEESCRDTLLSDLRQRLPEGVSAEPEGQYANDKRADIRVSCRDFQVPVEAKKNTHRDLWSAPRNQLIAKYTTDPATGGHGIYLVFWFGRAHTQPAPSGAPPTGPEELRERLKEAANLSPVEARKISICVIDVSRPDD